MPASPLTSVESAPMSLERFAEVLHAEQYAALRAGIEAAQPLFAGRTVWNVSSTADGGGVAEMLHTLLGYARGAGVDARWEVIGGDGAFFAITKRIHNHLHGFDGDGGALGASELAAYRDSLRPSGEALLEKVRAGDVVILHDPQTAGLVPLMRERGVSTIWRCHVGIDTPTEIVLEAWRFLLGFVAEADAAVFSRPSFVWDGIDPARTAIISPSIDAFSPKNQLLGAGTVDGILAAAGVIAGGEGAAPEFVRMDGSTGTVARRAVMTEGGPLRHGERFVLQISRWDALKDPAGVIAGFAERVAPYSDAHLVYAGPDVSSVADDPDGARVLADVQQQFARLPSELRERVHLAVLPMADPQENAAIVNALQHAASVVVQKSIAEGFGLTVAEAMWKARPVVASRVGGIQDQIEDGRSGLLLDEPRELRQFGGAVLRLLDDHAGAERMGAAARERVRERFLGSDALLAYLRLVNRLS